MKSLECQFEAQALAAVLESRWPQHIDSALREHISQCPICSEVAEMADTFDVARQHAHTAAALPDASHVWWMSQMRARREALQDAARPILATQLAAIAWAIGLLVVCLGAALTWFHSVITALLLAHGFTIALGVAVILLLPTAAYFAMGKE